MSRKKIYRAGFIPYIIEDGDIKMLFMKPSDTKYGGDEFQIAKGKIEQDEDSEHAALREAHEELGLLLENTTGGVFHVGNFLGRTEIYVAKIADKDLFESPCYETECTSWLTIDEFIKVGRKLHHPVVEAVVDLIFHLEDY